MRVVITGGGGFIGRRLALRLLERGHLEDDPGGKRAIDTLTLFDAQAPRDAIPDDPRLTVVVGDVSDEAGVREIISPDTGAVFHLAAVVSAGAEEDFDLGVRVNVDGTRAVLEACRALKNPPTVVFASSVAVYGGDLPSVVRDDMALTPQTSYGIHKAIGEHLINDYSRKGFIDGRALRLPTVVVRPGKPNRAASTWASSIIREPLQGQETDCPVAPEQAMWLLSARRAVDAFIRAAQIPAQVWGDNRSLAIPGITLTAAEMVAALGKVAGEAVAQRIRWRPDPFIRRLVGGWPTHFAPKRALAMGFAADEAMEPIIRAFIEDELGGTHGG